MVEITIINFLDVFHPTLSLISIFFNSLLIFLIIHKSPHKIGRYKYLMSYVALCQICVSIMSALQKPVITSFNTKLVCVTQKLPYLNDKTQEILNTLVSVSYLAIFDLFSIHFVYRYGAHTSAYSNYSINKLVFVASFLLPIISAIIYGALLFDFYTDDPNTEKIVKNAIFERFGLRPNEIVYQCVFLQYNDHHGAYLDDWRIPVFTAIILIIFELPAAIVIYYALKCYSFIRWIVSQKNISHSVQKLYRHLFWALVTQTLLSLLLIYLPLAFVFSCMLIAYDLKKLSFIISVTSAIFPAFDPLPTILLVTNYRIAVKNILFRIFGIQNKNRLVNVNG